MQTSYYRFMAAYDAFVQDVFTYFYSRIQQRDIAQRLTQETFTMTWKQVSRLPNSSLSMKQIHRLLRKNAERITPEQAFRLALDS